MMALLGWVVWLGVALADDAPRRFALVVGSNVGLSGEVPLRYAADDAGRFADALVRVGDVHEEDLVVLREPRPATVVRALDDLADRTRRVPDSVVIVFYSGHASTRALHLGGSTLGIETLLDRMSTLESQVQVLVVDACGSGALTRRKGVVAAEPFQIALGERLDTEGMAILTSSSLGEDAQESEHLQGGVFTHHLVIGMLGAADRSADGLVTLTEAYQYGYDQTVRSTSLAPTLQHPSFDIQLRGKKDLVVSRLERGAPAQLQLPLAGTWLVLSERRQDLVAEVTVTDPVALALPPGRYLLRRRHEEQLYQTSAEVLVGRPTLVAAETLRRMSAGETVRKGYLPRRPTAGVGFVGGGIASPFGIGRGAAQIGRLGLRVDTRALSFDLRGTVDAQRADEGDLASRQVAGGATLGVFRLQHLLDDHLVIGIGLGAGAQAVQQRFVTLGDAPGRLGAVGHVGSALRLETTVASRWLVGVQGALDVLALQRVDGTLATPVRPSLTLDFGVYLW